MAKKEKDFWDKFGDMMDGLGDYIEERAVSLEKFADKKGWKGYSSSTSVTEQNGVKIVTKTVNGKTKITINGEEMVPKKIADRLDEALRLTHEYIGPDALPNKVGWEHFDARKEYQKYKEKNK